MGVECIEYEVDLGRVKRSPLVCRAADSINEIFDLDQESSVNNLSDNFLIPYGKIREVIDGPVECDILRNEYLMLRKSSDFNQALQRSMMKLTQMGMFFPSEMSQLADNSVFKEYLKMYLYEMGVRVSIPTTQVRFHGALEGEDVYVVHVADVIGEELYVSDIMLCDPNDPKKRVEGGIGHGIFDEIMRRIEKYAISGQYKQIGLMAAYERNMHSFSKRGYEIELTVFGSVAKNLGMSYPMIKPLY